MIFTSPILYKNPFWQKDLPKMCDVSVLCRRIITKSKSQRSTYNVLTYVVFMEIYMIRTLIVLIFISLLVLMVMAIKARVLKLDLVGLPKN